MRSHQDRRVVNVQGNLMNLLRLQTVLVIITKSSFLYNNTNYESKARSHSKLNKASGQKHVIMTTSMLLIVIIKV